MGHSDIVANDVARNVATVRERIDAAATRAGTSGLSVCVLAAAKYVDTAAVRALLAAGVCDIAENRLESLAAKQHELGDEGARVVWHFIGSLQSRKVPDIASRVSMVHSLCTESAARKLAALAARGEALPRLLVEVNAAGDPDKAGVEPGDLARFLDLLPDGIVVHGLMTMPALADVAEQSRPAFAHLRALRDEHASRFAGRHPLTELSMGTSQDFEVAVEEGATLVRLGKVLYAVQE